MNHRERIEAALAGKATDRLPFGFWGHFPNEDRSPRRLAELTLARQRDLDLDFIKCMPYGLYSVVDWGVRLKVFEGYLDPPVQTYFPIHTHEDWAKLRPVSGDSGEYAVVLEGQRIMMSELKSRVPVVQTVFSPLTSAVKLSGEKALLDHINDHPGSVHAGLEIITETTRGFAEKALSEGADGLFFATQMSNRGKLTPAQHDEFVRRYDLAVLDGLETKSWFNILHLHGPDVMFEAFNDYPVHAFNWHDCDDGPPLSEVAEMTDKCLMGGLGHFGVLLEGAPPEVAAQVEDAARQMQGRRLILAPGCGAETRTPKANILQLKASIEALKW